MAITISGSGIVEANLADDAVTLAKIADNAVTLAKMASGTDGQIITYDASGNPAAVGPGSDGQVLTSTGSTTPPAFEAAAAAGISDLSPYFAAKTNGAQAIVKGTQTIVNFNVEIVDSDSEYNNSTYKFTPQTAGDYAIYVVLKWASSDTVGEKHTCIELNGSVEVSAGTTNKGKEDSQAVSSVITMNGSSDYLQVSVYNNTDSTKSVKNNGCRFIAFKIG